MSASKDQYLVNMIKKGKYLDQIGRGVLTMSETSVFNIDKQII